MATHRLGAFSFASTLSSDRGMCSAFLFFNRNELCGIPLRVTGGEFIFFQINNVHH